MLSSLVVGDGRYMRSRVRVLNSIDRNYVKQCSCMTKLKFIGAIAVTRAMSYVQRHMNKAK